MLNVYLSPQSDSKKHEDLIAEKNAGHPVKICNELDLGHKRRKLILSESVNMDTFSSLYSSDSGCFVEDTIHQSEQYIESAIRETSDLYLVLATKTIYEQDIVSLLIEFLKSRNYTNGLIEVFSTIIQELITNAVIHGNLGLDLCLRDILDPVEFDPEKAEELQQTFIKIQTLLNDPDYGLKPVMLRLNCFDNAVVLDIQDQGAGFDFENFQKKYHDTKFVKGMDLVFLMSKDIEYNKETKTLSLVLEDPDQEPLYELEINFSEVYLGVCTGDAKKFKKMKSFLEEIGVKQIKRISPEEPHWEKALNQIDLLLALSDLKPERMYSTVKEIRGCANKNDFPILCQKPKGMDAKNLEKLIANISDFISVDINMGELSRRLRAHLSIQKAQQDFTDFYTHYQSEIIQSRKTIEHFETIDTVIIRDEEYKKKFMIFASGSQTIVENIEDIDRDREEANETPIPYGNGFSFNRGEQNYFVFISMKNGLSSVLVSSYLKGYLERLKDGKEYLTPLQIIHRVQGYAEEVIPISVELNVFCMNWKQGENKFLYEQKGEFSSFKYGSKDKNLRRYSEADLIDESKYYMINEAEIIYIFDATISPDRDQLAGLSKEILEKENKELQFADKASLNFYSKDHRQIPYIAILPYQRKGVVS